MVNTRAKLKKIQNTLKICFPETASEADDQPTESGEFVGSIDDLLVEILQKLPVTSILRFKSVSKYWLSFLSHPRFTLMYDKPLIAPGMFVRNLYIPFDDENRSTPPIRSLDFYPDIHGIRIMQSCNGLLLCCSNQGKKLNRKYYVFNPTTKQFAVIPSVIGGQRVNKNIRFMGLAFHPIDYVQFKLICIYRSTPYDEDLSHNQNVKFKIQIYSRYTGKWRIIDESFTGPYYMRFRYGVYWNRAINWAFSLSFRATSFPYLLSLKLDNECLQKLPFPANVTNSGGNNVIQAPNYFGESRGHLHWVENSYEKNIYMNVYEMSSDYSGWFLKYHVELDDVLIGYQSRGVKFQVFDVVRGEKTDDDVFMMLKVPCRIIRYNYSDKSTKMIYYSSVPRQIRLGKDVNRYIETLGSF